MGTLCINAQGELVIVGNNGMCHEIRAIKQAIHGEIYFSLFCK
jgi:hypothetical protein